MWELILRPMIDVGRGFLQTEGLVPKAPYRLPRFAPSDVPRPPADPRPLRRCRDSTDAEHRHRLSICR